MVLLVRDVIWRDLVVSTFNYSFAGFFFLFPRMVSVTNDETEYIPPRPKTLGYFNS